MFGPSLVKYLGHLDELAFIWCKSFQLFKYCFKITELGHWVKKVCVLLVPGCCSERRRTSVGCILRRWSPGRHTGLDSASSSWRRSEKGFNCCSPQLTVDTYIINRRLSILGNCKGWLPPMFHSLTGIVKLWASQSKAVSHKCMETMSVNYLDQW